MLPPPPVVLFHGATAQRAVFTGAQIAPSPDGLMPPSEQTKPPSTRLSYREGKQSDSLALNQVQHAWRHSPPGPAMHTQDNHP